MRASESRYRRLFETARDGILLLNAETGQIEDVNPYLIETLGYSHAEFLGKKLWEVGTFADIPESKDLFHELQSKGYVRYEDLPLRTKAGTRVQVEFVSNSYDCDGIKVIQCNIRDITERKRAEEKQREATQLLDSIVENIPTAVQVKSVRDDFRILMWNKAAEAMYGLPRHAAIGRTVHDLWPESDAASMHASDLELAANKRLLDFPDRLAQTKDRGDIRVHMRKVALCDAAGNATHLLVIADDITAQLADQARLRESEARLRSLTELSSDWFWEQDEDYRFVKFSGGEGVAGWGPDQQQAVGLHRWDLGGVVPVSCGWDEHKALLDARKPYRNFEYRRILGDGRLQCVEASGEPVFDADGRFTGYRGVATDITGRKTAEDRIKRLNRVYAMLSGINSAIVRHQERGELFREVCRIALSEGGFVLARVIEVDSDGKARIAATSEADTQLFQRIVEEYNSDPEHSPSLLAVTLRSTQPVISNDVAGDPRIPNRAALTKEGNYALALLPIVVAQRIVGTVILRSREVGQFDAEEVLLLRELISNLAFALERIAEAGKLARMNRMNAMLSGINAAIVRNRDRQELFEEACRIAVETGALPFAWMGVVDATGTQLQLLASAGRDDGFLQSVRDRLAIRDDAPEAQGLSVRAIREGRAMVANDVAADAILGRRQAFADRGIKSVAVFPLFIASRVVASFALHSEHAGFFDDDELKLLNEMAGNIAFALEHIEKEEKVRRLTRVYAMLSGINALIVRVRSREELFAAACRIAVEKGRFQLAWIGAVDRIKSELVPVASAGSTEDTSALVNQRFSLLEGAPHGNAHSARAIREKKASVSNDVQNDPGIVFRDQHAKRGSRSMAILPLRIADEVVAILALYSGEIGFFDEEELALLTELAGDIAFSVDHIDKQDRLDYLAYYDELTGLANRRLFLERVAQYMRSAVTGGHKLALFCIDLERFRSINDSLGRPAGDALLKQVSEWLSHVVGDANLLARLGADQFAVVLPEVKQDGSVAGLLDKRVRTFLEHAFRLNDTEYRIAAKIGAALFPNDGTDAETLLRNAEAALKKAKAGGDRYLFYKSQMTDMVAGNLTMENQLREALDNEEFVLHYQPKINLESGQLTGAEALIRWNDPRTGLVPPGRFIPVLEETGLILDVGRWALRKAIGDYLRWRAAGLPAPRIAVNVSPLQLRHHGFNAEVERVLGIHADAAAGLELEITESLIMEDVKHNITSLQEIRAMGVTIAIDDFGTGFSSLSYLAQLPVDTLKIDRSFVVDMATGPQKLALISTIINLAHSLKLKVVAEGVETEEQSRILRLLRCDEMQGYLFSKPVPAELFETKFLGPAPVGAAA